MNRPVSEPSAEMLGIIESFAAGYRPGATVYAREVYAVLVRERCPLHGFPALSRAVDIVLGLAPIVPACPCRRAA